MAISAYLYCLKPYEDHPSPWTIVAESNLRNLDVGYPVTKTKANWNAEYNFGIKRDLDKKMQEQYGLGIGGGGLFGLGAEKCWPDTLHGWLLNVVMKVVRIFSAINDDVAAYAKGQSDFSSRMWDWWTQGLKLYMFRMGIPSVGSTNAAGACRFRIQQEDSLEECQLPEDAVAIIDAFLEQMCVVRLTPMCRMVLC
jgi:hypothetical protein